jgi:hypothetical protein
MKIRNNTGRLTQLFLLGEGLLHLTEIGVAYTEEAFSTMALVTLHSLVFFVSAYFVGHDLLHHRTRMVVL